MPTIYTLSILLLLFLKKKILFYYFYWSWTVATNATLPLACSVGWFVSLLIREEVLLAGLCEKKILFQMKIYNRLRRATAK